MNISKRTLKNEERASFALRELYRKYGYSHYKMSKFEEYDLYVRNKDFLISDGVITFTDTNGKLMALKPDVTLSIIKNCREAEGIVQKMYYNENVYRVSGSTKAFREMAQVGLECIGDIDSYCCAEVLILAAKSLAAISDEWVLNISHIGILTDVLGSLDLSEDDRRALIKCVSGKNLHEAARICGESEEARAFLSLISTYGKPNEVIKKLRLMNAREEYICELEGIADALSISGLDYFLKIDFSVADDIKYYNGIVFKGYIHGVPQSVLSGGRYDKLMERMGRRAGAIGFAVYLDLLEGLSEDKAECDADVVLLYGEGESTRAVAAAVARITDKGDTALAVRSIPGDIRYKKLMKIKNGEVSEVENA